MQAPDLQKEIVAIEFQIDYQEKKLDSAINNDLQLAESKKLLHEIRILQQKLENLIKQN
jgi:hypothetical protein